MDQGLKILILEDADYDAELIEYELGKLKLPFYLRRVTTREGFLEALAEFNPDLILADYRLPAFDGLTALALAQEECPRVPFIFVSGAMSPKLAEQGLKQGAADWIPKDRLSRLAAAVRRSLRPLVSGLQPPRNLPNQGEDYWLNIFHRTMRMMVVLSPEGTILEFNQGAEMLTGWPRRQVLGRDLVTLLVVEEKRDWAGAELARVAAGEPTGDFELPVLSRDGTVCRLLSHLSLLPGLPGQADLLLLLAEELRGRQPRPKPRTARTFTVTHRLNYLIC